MESLRSRKSSSVFRPGALRVIRITLSGKDYYGQIHILLIHRGTAKQIQKGGAQILKVVTYFASDHKHQKIVNSYTKIIDHLSIIYTIIPQQSVLLFIRLSFPFGRLQIYALCLSGRKAEHQQKLLNQPWRLRKTLESTNWETTNFRPRSVYFDN